MAIFSKGEMERRLNGFCDGLRKMDVDVAFLHTADNSFYLSGVPLLSSWGRPMWSIITADGHSCLIGAYMEKENMRDYSALEETHTFDDNNSTIASAIGLVKDFIRKGKAPKRIGLEMGLIPHSLYLTLEEAFPGVEFVDINPILEELRIIKSEEELKLLRLGGQVSLIGAEAFVNACQLNVSELEVNAATVSAMDRAISALYTDEPGGATSSYCFCMFGKHTLTPHMHPTNKRLCKGDVISLNVFPVIWGYAMALERTFVFGEPDEETLNALQVMTDACSLGRSLMGPGVLPCDVDKQCYDYLRNHGYDDSYFRHGTGHSQGIMIAEAGREALGDVRSYNKRPFSVNQLGSIEPSIYTDKAGFRHNDIMLMTENGAECLTPFRWDIGHCLK